MSRCSSPQTIPYPWHQAQWQGLLQIIEQQRLPHALLISGQNGIGKWLLAECLAAYLLCRTPRSGLACGSCRSCQLQHAQTHPDMWRIVLEDGAKLIKIEQIRQLAHGLSGTAQQGGKKVILLGPVEALNVNAANALLKNLEEPSKDTHFILVSHSASQTMATIRSRCQQLPLPLPEPSAVSNWIRELGVDGDVSAIMAMAGGAPLSVRDLLHEDIQEQLAGFLDALAAPLRPGGSLNLGSVNDWLAVDTAQLLGWWAQVSQLIIRPEADVDVNENYAFSHHLRDILANTGGCNHQWLFKLLDKILLSRKQVKQGSNLNQQLLLEDLLLDWYAILSKQTHKAS